MKSHRRANHPGRLAFTLIELLVVITVIAILAALLFPAIKTSSSVAREKNTRTLIAQVAMACEQFREMRERYPYSGVVSSNSLIEQLGPSLRIRRTFVVGEGDERAIVDAWARPIIYVRHIPETEDSPPDEDVEGLNGPIHNPKTFDLFSCGRYADLIDGFPDVAGWETFDDYQNAALELNPDKTDYRGNNYRFQNRLVNRYVGNW